MAQSATLYRQNKGLELPDSLRYAVITLHGLCGWSFQKIYTESGHLIPRTTASSIWHHAMTSAQIALSTTEEVDWVALLDYAEVSARSGHPKSLNPTLKSKLRSEYLNQPSEPFIQVAKQQNLNIGRETARQIALSPSPQHPYRIVKRKRPHKLILTAANAASRREYCLWLKEKLCRKVGLQKPRKVIFVMSDETPIYIGGPDRHHEYVTAIEGAEANSLAKPVDNHAKFVLQTLAACSGDHRQTRPCLTFQNDKDTKSAIQKQLNSAHAAAKRRSQKMIAAAADPSSEASEIVKQANIDMRAQHAIDLATGKKNTPKTKRPLSAEQVFKVDETEFKRTSEKGMDFAWYSYQWLLKYLYPYYYRVARANPDCDVYLIEDNSGSHTKARRFLQGHPLQQGILFAPQPANSPDLHPIERIFDALKDEMATFTPCRKNSAAVAEAVEQIRWIWQEAEMISNRIETMTNNATFIDRAKKCLKIDGWNFFHG